MGGGSFSDGPEIKCRFNFMRDVADARHYTVVVQNINRAYGQSLTFNVQKFSKDILFGNYCKFIDRKNTFKIISLYDSILYLVFKVNLYLM